MLASFFPNKQTPFLSRRENRAMANTYKVLAFKNLSNYVVEVTFHNYMDSFSILMGKILESILKMVR